MLCAVFLALLGSAFAVPVDVEADLKHNVDIGRLQKDLAALDGSHQNTAAVEAEIEQLKAAYEKTVIESPETLYGSTFEDEDINQLNEKAGLEKDLFEGDILLTSEQRAMIEKSNRTRRQAFSNEWYSWGKVNPVIPYSYAATYPKAARAPIITAAMKFWEKNTCVQFKEVNKGYRVEIRDSTGCSSFIGNVHDEDEGKQSLDLGQSCMSIGVVCHELSHTFGFFHEQSRFDRDKFVSIDFKNINALGEHQFDKEGEDITTLRNIPYEFGSNRHYNNKDFAKDSRKPVIYAKPAYKVYQEGMFGHLPTFYDILAVNRHFNCSARCTNTVTCANGGVQDVNNCTKSLCPMGWTGDKCDQRPYHGKMPATTKLIKKQIKMPARANIKDYRNQYYIISAPRGMRVQMTPKILSVRYSNSCKYSGIEVKFLKDARLTGLQLCDSRIRLPTLTSATNEMLVQAYSMGDKFEVELQFKAIK